MRGAVRLALLLWLSWASTSAKRSSSKHSKDPSCPSALKRANYEELNEHGIAFQRQGDANTAFNCYQAALKKKPTFAMAYFNMGTLADDAGNHKQAVVQYRKVILLAPTFASAYYNMGSSFYRLGQFEDAATNFKHATIVDPNYVFAHANLAAVYAQQGRLEEAQERHMLSIKIDPLFTDGWMNLGNVLKAQGQFQQAVESYNTAIKINPQHSSAYYNLGVAYWETLQVESAMEAYASSLHLDPTFANTYFNLGLCYQHLGHISTSSALSHALECFRSATVVSPTYFESYNNMAAVLENMQRPTEALAAYKMALSLDDSDSIFANLFHNLQELCDWSELDTHLARLTASLPRELARPKVVPGVHPLHAASYPVPAALVTRVARRHAMAEAKRGGGVRYDTSLVSLPIAKSGGRIVLGYVLGDKGQTGPRDIARRTLELMIDAHDRRRVQIVVYLPTMLGEQPMEDDEWYLLPRTPHPSTARTVAESISARGVHLLVDTTGHNAGGRLALFALRPAPLQVLLFGHWGSAGAEYIRHMVSDRTILPPEHAHEEATEGLMVLSRPLLLVPSHLKPNSPPKRALLLKRLGVRATDGHRPIVTGLGPPWRLTPKMLDAWTRATLATGDALLWLPLFSRAQESFIVREIVTRGLARERVVLGAPENWEHDYWVPGSALADVVLETGPYFGAGHWLTLPLAAGVPVVSLAADRMSGRVASAHGSRGVVLVWSLEEVPPLVKRLVAKRAQIRAGAAQGELELALQKQTRAWIKDLETGFSALWDLAANAESAASIVVAL